MKMCLLKSHNHLGINSGLNLLSNFFSTSSISSFFKTQETDGLIVRKGPEIKSHQW